jgi:hypothetical protein
MIFSLLDRSVEQPLMTVAVLIIEVNGSLRLNGTGPQA